MQLKGYQLSILLIISGMALFASAVGSVLQESDTSVLPVKFSFKQANFYAIKKDSNCLLSLEVTWTKQIDGGSLFVTGFIPNQSGNSLPLLKGEFSFNQFDQFFGSVIEFPKVSEVPGRFLQIGSQGVTPIEISAKGQLFDNPLSFKLSANGPITLVRIKEFGWISIPKSQLNQSVQMQDRIGSINISIVPINNKSECMTDGNIDLNLPQAFKAISELVTQFNSQRQE